MEVFKLKILCVELFGLNFMTMSQTFLEY